jgi:hypothetical protein
LNIPARILSGAVCGQTLKSGCPDGRDQKLDPGIGKGDITRIVDGPASPETRKRLAF